MNLLTANQKTYSVLAFVLQKKHAKIILLSLSCGCCDLSLVCNKRILRFHRPGMKAPAAPAAEPELLIQKFNFVYFSLNSDTRIYIFDILLLLGLNVIYNRHTYHYNSPHNSEFINILAG